MIRDVQESKKAKSGILGTDRILTQFLTQTTTDAEDKIVSQVYKSSEEIMNF